MSGSAPTKPDIESYGSAWRAQNIANTFNTLTEAGLIPDDAHLNANGGNYDYTVFKADGTIDMDKLTIKADESNASNVSNYITTLNNLSEDSEFNVLGAQTADRESAYNLGVDKGRK